MIPNFELFYGVNKICQFWDFVSVDFVAYFNSDFYYSRKKNPK